jgi:hypothetical protein
VALKGADFITTNSNKVVTVKGYFDSAEVPRQLGMQIIVQPDVIGPVQFGDSTYLSLGKRTRPGAFSITSLRVRSEDEVRKVQKYSQGIFQQLAGMKGFISSVTGRAGGHMFTVTAWETPEDSRQLRGGPHQEAMNAFYGPDFTLGGVTSVWTPHRINPIQVRCAVCGEMSATREEGSTCSAGHKLPDSPPYW